MELYHLRSFVTVADEGHLTRAAQRLFTSQPAVSAHIKTLEEELGVSLFSRTPKGMQLTQEGLMLKTHAEKCLNTVSDFFHQAKSLQENLVGVAKVSLHTSPELLKVGEFFSILNARYPNIECHLLQKNSWEVADLLRAREIDAGFLYGTSADEDIAVTLLRSCKLMIVGPTKWREQFEYAELEEIVRLPWIGSSKYCPFHKAIFDTFQQRNLKLSHTVAVVDQEPTLMNLINAGVGMALMVDEDALAVEESGRGVSWKKDSFTIDLSMAYLQKRQDDPIVQAVLNSVFMVWGQADKGFAVHPSL